MLSPTLSPAPQVEQAAGISDFWTLLTVASLAKNVGRLTERYQGRPELLSAVRELESKLEAVMLTAPSDSHATTLLRLTQEVEALS